jgi:hypothetical protein
MRKQAAIRKLFAHFAEIAIAILTIERPSSSIPRRKPQGKTSQDRLQLERHRTGAEIEPGSCRILTSTRAQRHGSSDAVVPSGPTRSAFKHRFYHVEHILCRFSITEALVCLRQHPMIRVEPHNLIVLDRRKLKEAIGRQLRSPRTPNTSARSTLGATFKIYGA